MASYTRVNWQNKVAGGTKLGATNLNVMDAGIDDLYSLPNAKGDLIVATAADTLDRLAVGTNNYALVADSSQTAGVKWVDLGTLVVPLSTVTAKGDLLVGTGSGAVDNLPVGTNDYALIAASGETTGVKWGPTAQTYTPALTASSDPSLGSGGNFTQWGRYMQLGNLVWTAFYLRFGSTSPSAGSGTYAVSLPVTAANPGGIPMQGVAWLYDNNASTTNVAAITRASGSTLNLRPHGANLVTHAVPWTWADSDIIAGVLVYQAA